MVLLYLIHDGVENDTDTYAFPNEFFFLNLNY